ncbi:MAG: class I SAM-dependent methyltransferase [Candidatus Peregrinibacteria bacterium]|nr:class I SAM-dependent methyltransferase [Candidatus Peregrinibacteria bacterium]MCB9807778.1 class I SAM-dependent methyltransferase [Candidatus Peribacteria bacterium]
MKLIDKYYRYIRPFRFLYGGVKDTVSHAQSSKRAEEWKAKGYQGAKLDVCGGRNPFNRNEFLNVDVVDFPQVDLVFDVTKRFPIPDKVIVEIISLATLEHLRAPHVDHVLHEFYRVMAPGSRVRISTPDIEAIAQGVIDGDDLGILNQHLFGKFKSDDTEDLDLHKSMFPAETMCQMLEDIGFENAKRIPMDIGMHDANYNYLVEAYKPV